MFPIHLNLGFRQFYFYEGVYFLTAIVLAYLWAVRRLKANGLSPDQFTRALVGVLFGAMIGGRLFHFLFWQPGPLITDPLVFLRFWEGGISITGGLAGGILGGALAFVRRNESFWEYFAVLSPAILLGQALGRIGCFLNGDAWGIPTDLPWGLRFPRFGTELPSGTINQNLDSFAWTWGYRQGLVGSNDLTTPPLHPTQLYECLGDLAILGLVLLAFRRFGQARGGKLILALHIGAYSLLRFALEFLHGDRDQTVLAGMTWLQITLLVVAAACLALMLLQRKVAARGRREALADQRTDS